MNQNNYKIEYEDLPKLFKKLQFIQKKPNQRHNLWTFKQALLKLVILL